MAHSFRKRMLWIQAGLMLAAAVFGFGVVGGSVTSAAQTVEAVTPTPNGGGYGQIAFASNIEGDSHLYLTDADGGNLRRLSDMAVNSWTPAWSPDGSQIAFVSNDNLYTMQVDTSSIRLLIDSRKIGGLAWSPGGTQLAVNVYNGTPLIVSDIFVLSLTTNNIRNVTNHPARYSIPVWSEDEKQLAFSYDPGASDPTDIFVLDLSNDSISNLTHQSGYNTNPVWISNGQQIAFTSYGVSPKKIYLIDVDGSNLHSLTPNYTVESIVDWSLDGQRIAFCDHNPNSWYGELSVFDSQSGQVQRLTRDRYCAQAYRFSPDWTRIAFVEYQSGSCILSVMSTDGTNVHHLTDCESARGIAWFDWRP